MKNHSQNIGIPIANDRSEVGAAHLPEGLPSDSCLRLQEDGRGDVMDTAEFRQIVRDAVEASEAEEALIRNVPTTARLDIDRVIERKRLSIRLVFESGLPISIRSIQTILASEWTPEHVARLGRAPCPTIVELWCRIGAQRLMARQTRGSNAAVERAYWDMKRWVEEAASREFPRLSSSGKRSASDGRDATSEGRPNIGRIVPVDGFPRRYLGRTVGGRKAAPDLSAPASRAPAVGIADAHDALTRDTSA